MSNTWIQPMILMLFVLWVLMVHEHYETTLEMVKSHVKMTQYI